jgi:tetratricopeptide (TPR) repeat protein
VVSTYLAQAITQCEQAIITSANNPEQWQAAFSNLGNLLQGRAEFDRAVVWHSLALDPTLNIAEAYSQLGELHLLENNLTAALGSFENALEYLPRLMVSSSGERQRWNTGIKQSRLILI